MGHYIGKKNKEIKMREQEEEEELLPKNSLTMAAEPLRVMMSLDCVLEAIDLLSLSLLS